MQGRLYSFSIRSERSVEVLMYEMVAGLGARGGSAITQLLQAGEMTGAEVWCIDAERRTVDAPHAKIHILETDAVSFRYQCFNREHLHCPMCKVVWHCSGM